VERCSSVFTSLQSESLEEAVALMGGPSGLQRSVLYEARQWFAGEWERRMALKPLDRE
jgi:hypothetical protein